MSHKNKGKRPCYSSYNIVLASKALDILRNPNEEKVLSISNDSSFHSAIEALDKKGIRISRRYDYDPKSGKYTCNIRTLLFLPHETCEYSDDNIKGVEVLTSVVAAEAKCDTSSGMLLLFKLSPNTEHMRDEPSNLTAEDLVFGHNCLYKKKSAKWVLEGDIKGCFNKIGRAHD